MKCRLIQYRRSSNDILFHSCFGIVITLLFITLLIQSIQKRLTFVVMYLCILNIERAKNFGGNFHVNELHKLISLLVLTQDVIFWLRKLLTSVDLYYISGASIATK